jgi:ABC-type amino acid transport substrate-binding protein
VATLVTWPDCFDSIYIKGKNGDDCIAAVANGSALATLFDEPAIQYFVATNEGFMVCRWLHNWSAADDRQQAV